MRKASRFTKKARPTRRGPTVSRPDVVVALKDKKLLPVSQLDRGFIHPEYPEQILVSYYQAGRICDYIQERWGADKLVEMVHAFAELKPTPDVIQQSLGLAPAAFDEQFQAWVYQNAGPIVDEVRRVADRPEAPRGAGQRAADSDAALQEGEAVRRLYPEYVEDANAYEFLAEIKIAKGDKAGAMAVLVDYQKFGGSNPTTLKKLASLQEESGTATRRGRDARRHQRHLPGQRRRSASPPRGAVAEAGELSGAVREYAAVVALHPLDKAGALYDLAQAYFAAHQLDKAEADRARSARSGARLSPRAAAAPENRRRLAEVRH